MIRPSYFHFLKILAIPLVYEKEPRLKMKAAEIQQLNNEISGRASKERITYVIKIAKRKTGSYEIYF